MKIQIIVGSVRVGRVAIQVAQSIESALTSHLDAQIELVDLKQWNLPFYSGRPPMSLKQNYTNVLQQQWSHKISEADAFILISPEYNHGYSPVLKNALDYLGTEWKHKPVAFVGYGSTNGSRSIEQLRSVTTALGMVDLNQTFEIRDIFSKIKDQPFTLSEFEQNLVLNIGQTLLTLAKKLQFN